MGISRDLQRLRHSIRSSRLLKLLLAMGVAMIVSSPTSTRCKDEFSQSPEPLTSSRIIEDLAFVEMDIGGGKWHVAALLTTSVGDLMADLSMKGAGKYPFPWMIIVQDSLDAKYVIVFGQDRQISLSSMKHLIEIGQKKENLTEVKLSSHQNGCRGPLSFFIALN
jgi:hypothetical protein